MVDTSITQPARLDPPFKEPMLDAAGLVTEVWRSWFTGITLAMFGIAVGGARVIMQSGTSTSDSLGAIGVTLPVPFSLHTIQFQVDASPTEPTAYYVQGAVGALPLDFISGLLGKDDGSGGILAVPNTNFTWFAMGV